ncbi:MAG: hypothetical protein QOG21_501 [Actinomycetota bacterium]|jgi:hypothetical protein|nr:hypothetical protein [Actinomycetota bacterium]
MMQINYISHMSCVAGQVERLRVAQLERDKSRKSLWQMVRGGRGGEESRTFEASSIVFNKGR